MHINTVISAIILQYMFLEYNNLAAGFYPLELNIYCVTRRHYSGDLEIKESIIITILLMKRRRMIYFSQSLK